MSENNNTHSNSSNQPQNPFKEQERALNAKLMELQALFEMSQILNSSLNLKSILDNMLLTPMGKMMISKGIILLNQKPDIFEVETLKGLPRTLIGKQVQIESDFITPIFVNEINENWCQFFKNLGIVVLLPISSNKKNLGIIGFGGKIAGMGYLQAELDFLNSLSNIAATSIENGLIFQELNAVNRKLDRKNQELNTLFEIGKELNSTLDSAKILSLLLYAIMGEMVVNRCAVLLKQGQKMELYRSKGLGNIDQEIQAVLDESLQKKLCHLGIPLILNDLNSEDSFNSLVDINFQVLVPMRIQAENQGVIMIGPKIINQNFTDDELEFLYTLGNQAMISLENARLFEETLEKQKLEEELNIARDIQRRLLPKSLPELEHFEIVALNDSSRQVGGDYYDCIKIDDTSYAIAIADVSGKGAPASLLMSNVQASLHSLIGTDLVNTKMIQKINNLIYSNTSADKFITFFYGILDIEKFTYTSCNAGHNPPYLFHEDGSFQLLEQGGLLLGMFPDMKYEIEEVSLKPGDWLILYTDGVNEAINEQDEEFGTERIEMIVRKNMGNSAQEMLDALLFEIRAFANNVPQSDDITMVIIKIK